MRTTHLAVLVGVSLLPLTPVRADLVDINLIFDGTVSAARQAVFEAAAVTWESILFEYQAASGTPTTVDIDVSLPMIDDSGGILGSGGPDTGVSAGGFVYTETGGMELDIDDVPNLEAAGTFDDVILHELAHVMGFGTWWVANGVYVNGTGMYTGAFALAAWQTEFGQTDDTFVPVELGGGPGTANSHWNEVDGGASFTGITDSMGRDLRDELMTGWLNVNPFISRMTEESFRDIGYNVVGVPEPASLAMMAMASAAFVLRRRRRGRSRGV